MRYIQELQRMSDSDIHPTIVCVYSDCFKVSFGDAIPVVHRNYFERIETGMEWLINEVVEVYPDSMYARIRIRMINKIRECFFDTDKVTDNCLNRMLWENERKRPSLYSEIKTSIEKGE